MVAWRTLHSYFDDVLESVEEADRLISTPDSDPKALILAAYRGSEYNIHPINRATWDQIVSSGHLRLLPRSAVGSGVSDYYKYLNTDISTQILNSTYRHAVRSAIPLPVQLSIREACSDIMNDVNVAVGLHSDCDLDIEESTLSDTAQQLRSSMAVRENLRNQYSLIAFVQINNEGNIVLLERVIKALKENKVE